MLIVPWENIAQVIALLVVHGLAFLAHFQSPLQGAPWKSGSMLPQEEFSSDFYSVEVSPNVHP
jgi:hypothetical protein